MDTSTVHDLLYAIDKIDALITAVEFMESDDMDVFVAILHEKREHIDWIIRDRYDFILEKEDLF